MFSYSRNLAISGGNFTQVFPLGVRGIDLLRSVSSPSAIHNSGERFPPPKCHANTRVAVIDRLMRWIHGHEDQEALIMWLLGPAGAGKSAIAQTLAELCHSLKILLASFFFCRSDPTRNHSQPLFSTIAYQVAINLPDARDLVERVPKDDPMVLTQSIEEQLSSLIIKPLQELYHSGRPTASSDPYVIIIDGLDECRDRAMQISVLQVISKALSTCQLPLKFLIATRPEVHLTSEFNSRTINPILSRVALDDNFLPNDDIRRFFQDKFKEIKQMHPLASLIDPSWPPADTIERLIHKSSGQFIFASTVIKYITSISCLPTTSLDVVLGLCPSSVDTPFADLDALYINILSSVRDIEKTRAILGFLIFSTGTSPPRFLLTRTDFLDDFLTLNRGDSYIFSGDLASVLALGPVGKDGHKNIDVLHASLSDFLLDRSRSKKFALDPAEVHAQLACMCLRALPRYLSLKVNDSIPPLLSAYQYAYHNMIEHCSAAAPTVALRNAILEFSHNSHLQHQKYEAYLESTPIVIAAIRATPFDDAEIICAPHVAIFKTFLFETLPHYYLDSTVTFFSTTESSPYKVPEDLRKPGPLYERVQQATWVDGTGSHLFELWSR